MTARSVEMPRLQGLVRRYRLKTSAREACRLLGIDLTTEWQYRQAMEKAGLLAGDPSGLPAVGVIQAAAGREAQRSIAQQEASTVEPWRAHIEPEVRRGAEPHAIRDCLRLSHSEFTCSESGVKRFVARLQREVDITAADVVLTDHEHPEGRVTE